MQLKYWAAAAASLVLISTQAAGKETRHIPQAFAGRWVNNVQLKESLQVACGEQLNSDEVVFLFLDPKANTIDLNLYDAGMNGKVIRFTRYEPNHISGIMRAQTFAEGEDVSKPYNQKFDLWIQNNRLFDASTKNALRKLGFTHCPKK